MAGLEKKAKKVMKQAEGASKKSSGGKKASGSKKSGNSGADKAKRAAKELLK